MQFPGQQIITVHIDSLGFDMIDMTWFSALLLGAGCLALGYFIGARHSARIFLSPRVSKGAEIVVDGKSKNRGKQPLEIERLADILEDFKMVLVVRNDLKMGKGKIAAQCSHATLGLYKKLANRAPKSLNRWELCGQVKVVVKIESEDDMLVLQAWAKQRSTYQLRSPPRSLFKGQQMDVSICNGRCEMEKAKSLNLQTHITIDAGRTQIAPNSRTVMAVLGPADMVDNVTGGLKLL